MLTIKLLVLARILISVHHYCKLHVVKLTLCITTFLYTLVHAWNCLFSRVEEKMDLSGRGWCIITAVHKTNVERDKYPCLNYIHHNCSWCKMEMAALHSPPVPQGKLCVCGTEGSAFFPLLVVCSAIGGGSGDSMIHLTSTLEVVRGWQSCRRRIRDSFAVWGCEPWGGISFIAFISLPWPSPLISFCISISCLVWPFTYKKYSGGTMVRCWYHGSKWFL